MTQKVPLHQGKDWDWRYIYDADNKLVFTLECSWDQREEREAFGKKIVDSVNWTERQRENMRNPKIRPVVPITEEE